MEKTKKCETCSKQYTDDLSNKFSLHIKDYCKFLGACSDICFYNLAQSTRQHLFIKAIHEENKKMI